MVNITLGRKRRVASSARLAALVLVIVHVSCSGDRDKKGSVEEGVVRDGSSRATEEEHGVPRTVKAAVDYTLERMSDRDKQALRRMKREDLILTHHGLGTWIRNNLGLWSGNTDLMEATGEGHPDDASGIIVEAVWARLRATSRPTEP
jgi:hypothetical protein